MRLTSACGLVLTAFICACSTGATSRLSTDAGALESPSVAFPFRNQSDCQVARPLDGDTLLPGPPGNVIVRDDGGCVRLGGADWWCWRRPDVSPGGPSEGGVSVVATVRAQHITRCDADIPPRPRLWGDGRLPTELSAQHVTFGRWHACAADEILARAWCWGRNDVGQTGADSVDLCAEGGSTFPCRKQPGAWTEPELVVSSWWMDGKNVGLTPGIGPRSIQAGDMFTCAQRRTLVCWGASRDGWFGSSDACPPDLSQHWPTQAGETVAAHAGCARKPEPVLDLGQPLSPPSYGVGPRGLCGVNGDHVRCVGAISSPNLSLTNVWVSQGDIPAACGVSGDDLYCWGDGYSGPAGTVTRVEFDDVVWSKSAVIDRMFSADLSCQVHRGCDTRTQRLPICAPDQKTAKPWADLQAGPTWLVNTVIRTRGHLLINRNTFSTFVGCQPGACCNRHSTSLELGPGPDPLRLKGHGCVGDESRQCCDLPAYGQEVVVSGRLQWSKMISAWEIQADSICEVGAR